jgi:hypothetical protein
VVFGLGVTHCHCRPWPDRDNASASGFYRSNFRCPKVNAAANIAVRYMVALHTAAIAIKALTKVRIYGQCPDPICTSGPAQVAENENMVRS